MEKLGEAEGPQHTSTAADHMKPWPNNQQWEPGVDFPMDDGDDDEGPDLRITEDGDQPG